MLAIDAYICALETIKMKKTKKNCGNYVCLLFMHTFSICLQHKMLHRRAEAPRAAGDGFYAAEK